MSLSTATRPTLPAVKGVPLRSSHRIRTSVQCLAFKSGSTPVLKGAFKSGSLITPVLKVSEVGVFSSQARRTFGRANQVQLAASAACTSAIDARYAAAAETQTLSKKSPIASIVSPPGREMLPMLDDGGSGFGGTRYTPYYRGDGSGGSSGGGGGGPPASGEFPWGDYWLYIFLFLLRFLIMNIIGEGSCVYKYEDGRNKPIRRYT